MHSKWYGSLRNETSYIISDKSVSDHLRYALHGIWHQYTGDIKAQLDNDLNYFS